MTAEPAAVVLLYHRVHRAALDPWGLCVTPEHFREHVGIVAERFQPVALGELVAGLGGEGVPPRAVAVTFDDGYADVFHVAVPMLRERAVPATFFLVSEMIGRRSEFWWDELESILLRPGRLPRDLELRLGGRSHRWILGEDAECDRSRLLSHPEWRAWRGSHPTARHAAFYGVWATLQQATADERATALDELRAWAAQVANDELPIEADRRAIDHGELRELAAIDPIEIGAHTRTHPSLAALDRETQQQEISGSKRDLEAWSGRLVEAFSYPFGLAHDLTDETVDLVRRNGFRSACINVDGVARRGCDLFRLPRLNILDCDGAQFAARLEEVFAGR